MSYPALKDSLHKDAITRLADSLNCVFPNFKRDSFISDCLTNIEPLALKARVHHIIDIMHQHLPQDYTKVAKVLPKVKDHWNAGNADTSNNGFAAWPLIDYNAVYGINHPDLALPVLESLTELFSAEFAIQYFLQEHFDLSYQHIQRWASHSNEHVRRLASEGMRPRLPWGIKMHSFCENPASILPILTALKSDKSLYVRKSVANNINDISKDNPGTAIGLCQDWQEDATRETQWIIKHGLRSLIKAGKPEVFPLLGFTPNPELTIQALCLSKPVIAVGEKLDFELTLESTSEQKQTFVIDYAIHFVKANGQLSQKVFKLKDTTLKSKQSISLSKSYNFIPKTTRRYYAGEHRLDILINGMPIASQNFTLNL